MHGYDVHDAFYINCEIHGLWDRGSGTMAGPIQPYNENGINLTFSLLQYMFVKNLMHSYDVHEVFYLSCEIRDPQDQ